MARAFALQSVDLDSITDQKTYSQLLCLTFSIKGQVVFFNAGVMAGVMNKCFLLQKLAWIHLAVF